MKILTLLLIAASLSGQSIDSAVVDAIIRDALAASRTPGAGVAVVKDDRVVYLRGHGVRELAGGRLVTPDSLFCIGSLTKAFTATSIAMLVDEGKMAWDDPRKHLDYFHLADPLGRCQRDPARSADAPDRAGDPQSPVDGGAVDLRAARHVRREVHFH